MEKKFIDNLIRYRAILALLSIILTALITLGAQKLYFEADYKIYFEKNDPHLIAHEEIQDAYTKTDNIAILIKPEEGDIFNKRMLSLLYELTETAWQTPYVVRVDSLTNFQHTAAEGDDLLVDSLVIAPGDLTPERIAQVKDVAMSESELFNRMISVKGDVALINVILELPPEVDPEADIRSSNITDSIFGC